MSNVLAWLAAMGVQLDDHQPDARQLAHIEAMRQANAQNRAASSTLTRLATAVGLLPVAAGPVPNCCPA